MASDAHPIIHLSRPIVQAQVGARDVLPTRLYSATCLYFGAPDALTCA